MNMHGVILILLLSGMAGVVYADRAAAGRAGDAVLPRVQYRDVRAPEAFEELAALSRQFDPDGVGINIIYNGPTGNAAPRLTLSLRRVSLYDAIRYVCEVAGLYYRVDEHAVVISAQPQTKGRIVTRFYPVQPTILDVIRDAD